MAVATRQGDFFTVVTMEYYGVQGSLPGIPRGRKVRLMTVQDVATAAGVSKPTVVRWVAEKGRKKTDIWLPAPDFLLGSAWAWHPTSIEPVIVEMRKRQVSAHDFAVKKATAARKGLQRRAEGEAARRKGVIQGRIEWLKEQRAKGTPNFD